MTWLDRVLAVGPEYAHWSTFLTGEDKFAAQLDRAMKDLWTLETVLEIGTHRGVSASFIAARTGAHVTTIDSDDCSELATRLWDALGVSAQIVAHWGVDRHRKREIAHSTVWDLVYIDGGHQVDDVLEDWSAVTGYARAVLLHDYGDTRPGMEGPTHLVNTVYRREGWKMDGCFAYWRAHGRNRQE